METILKILKLLPDNWILFLDKAEEMEGHLTKRIEGLEGYKNRLDQVIEQLFVSLGNLDFENVKTKLHSNENFKKYENVNLDFLNLFFLPEDFDPDSTQDIKELIENKLVVIKDMLSDLEFDKFDLDIVHGHLQNIISTVMDIPEDLDLNDKEAVLELKNEKLEQLQPAVLGLMKDFFNITSEVEYIETKVKTFKEVSDAVFSSNRPETNTEEEQDSPLFSTIQQKIPKVEKALIDNEVNFPGIEQDQIKEGSQKSQEAFKLIDDNIPELEKLLNGLDWENLQPETVVNETKPLLDLLLDLLNKPPFSDIFLLVKDQFGFIGLKEGTDTQAFINEIKALADFPDDLNTADIQEMIDLAKNKVSELIDLLSKVEIEGIDTESMLTKIKDFTDNLFTSLSSNDKIKTVNAQVGFVGLKEGTDTEALLNEIKALVAIPNDLNTTDIQELIALAKSKMTGLVSLLSKVEIEGIDTEGILTKIKNFTDDLFGNDETRTVKDLCAVLFDQLVAFLQAQNFEAGKKVWMEILQKIQIIWQFARSTGIHMEVKEKIDLHVESPSINKPERMMNGEGELLEKSILFQQRTHSSILTNDPDGDGDQSNLNVEEGSQEDQLENGAPSTTEELANNTETNPESSEQQPSIQTEESIDEALVTSTDSEAELASANTDTANIDEQASEPGESSEESIANDSPSDNPNSEESTAYEPSFQEFMEDWVLELLNDEQSSLHAALDATQKEILQSYFNGNLKDTIIDTFQTMANEPYEELIEELKTKRERLTGLLWQEPSLTVGELVDYVLDEISSIVALIKDKLKDLAISTVNWLYDLLEISLEVLQHLKVPKSRIPVPLFNFITQGRDPNILCLMVVLPVVTIQSLLDIPDDNMDDWLTKASA